MYANLARRPNDPVQLVRDGPLQPNVPATGTDREARGTGRDLPALGHHIPHRKRVPREAERDCRRPARRHEHAVEALQIPRSRLGRCRWAQVQLGYLGSVHGPVVRQCEAHRDHCVMKPNKPPISHLRHAPIPPMSAKHSPWVQRRARPRGLAGAASSRPANLQVRVVERRVRQTKAELEPRLNARLRDDTSVIASSPNHDISDAPGQSAGSR